MSEKSSFEFQVSSFRHSRRSVRGPNAAASARAGAAALLLGLLAAGAQAAAPYVLLPDGRKSVGTTVRADKDGQILLDTAQGTLTFPKGTRVVVDEPADLARAAQMMEQNDSRQAAALLQRIANDYRFLGWDRKARVLLARAFSNMNDFANAAKTYEEALAEDPTVLDDADARSRYVKALDGSGQREKLAVALEATIAKGPRSAAAEALVMRGKAAQGAGETEKALCDFLCVSELFRDEKASAAEATFRAAECLERLNDARAAAFYAAVVKDFATSPFAAQARTKAAGAPTTETKTKESKP